MREQQQQQSGGVHILFFFVFLPLFYTPRDACEPKTCEKLRILLGVLFLDFLLLIIASLPDLTYFLSLPSSVCDFSYFPPIVFFDLSTSSCCFHSFCLLFLGGCGPLGFCGDLYRVPHIYISDTYTRGPPFFHVFV